MAKQISFDKFDYTQIGDPLRIGDKTVRAVARVSGFKAVPNRSDGTQQTGEDATSGRRGKRADKRRRSGVSAGAFVRVSPVEFIVRDGDDEPASVVVRDPGSEAIRGIASAAVAIAAVSVAVSMLAGFVRSLRN